MLSDTEKLTFSAFQVFAYHNPLTLSSMVKRMVSGPTLQIRKGNPSDKNALLGGVLCPLGATADHSVQGG